MTSKIPLSGECCHGPEEKLLDIFLGGKVTVLRRWGERVRAKYCPLSFTKISFIADVLRMKSGVAPKRWQTPFCVFLKLFLLVFTFFFILTENVLKYQKDDLNRETAWTAPVSWSKYITMCQNHFLAWLTGHLNAW